MSDSKKPMDANRFLSALVKVFKAIPQDKLDDVADIVDIWNEPSGEHKNPDAREVNIAGPGQPMRGGNASSMVASNSSFAPQEGLTEQYNAFNQMFGSMKKSIERHDRALKAMHDLMSDVVKGHQDLGTAVQEMVKAAEQPVVATPDENTFFGKAQVKAAKARAAYRKAELTDEEDEDERAERKSHLSAAADLLKSAKRLLAKAEEDSKAEEEDEIEKAVAAVKALSEKVTKAIAVIQKAEDEEKKEEEEEAAKKAAAAVPAATVKAEEDKTEEDEKKDDTAAKAQLDGLMVQVKSLQDVIAGLSTQSRNGGQSAMPPSFIKAAPASDIRTRLNDAIDNDSLDTTEIVMAQSLSQKLGAADRGLLPHADVLAEIAKAPEPVRNIFQAAA